jgi:activator of HSP90 ATPase
MNNFQMFVAFTNGSGRIDPQVGGTFEMFGGNVHGKILELQEPTKIVQEWRFRSWPDGIFSRVIFEIHQNEDSTEITVNQTGVPKSDLERTKEGWEKYYWDAMKRTFGFGSMML